MNQDEPCTDKYSNSLCYVYTIYKQVYTLLNTFVQYITCSDMYIQKHTCMLMQVRVHSCSDNVYYTYMSAIYNFMIIHVSINMKIKKVIFD